MSMRQTAGGRLDRVHHIAIIAADDQASKRFYCDVLGCELLGEVYRTERPAIPRSPGLRHFAFEVDAIGPVGAALVAKGVQGEPIRADPHTGRAMMFFADPDGLPLDLYER